eukprot:TRINITY_DN49341_c0_g2_i1.p1 TRINITY_DN49341_c0_g2~~TRINITY_DN49341_c0_g2_i1.p1  ORF type:complete len:171 (+),score=1.09 TRINITY_DN49341_c0_g2_i1:57-515(+)
MHKSYSAELSIPGLVLLFLGPVILLLVGVVMLALGNGLWWILHFSLAVVITVIILLTRPSKYVILPESKKLRITLAGLWSVHFNIRRFKSVQIMEGCYSTKGAVNCATTIIPSVCIWRDSCCHSRLLVSPTNSGEFVAELNKVMATVHDNVV